mgnify:CR=1 FL=1
MMGTLTTEEVEEAEGSVTKVSDGGGGSET